jgi:hypothetical protein
MKPDKANAHSKLFLENEAYTAKAKSSIRR